MADHQSEPNPERWIESARESIATGDTEEAVQTAYASVMPQLQEQVDVSDSPTHREFVAATTATDSDIDVATLETVAGAYEQAVFTGSVDTELAEDAIAAAEELVGPTEHRG